MINMLVAYYSAYGHTYEMAKAVCEGARKVSGTNVQLVRIPEFTDNWLAEENMYKDALKKQKDVRVATLEDLKWADGIIWGIPTRYGSMPAQMKYFIEMANELWWDGDLEGKPFGVFVSTGHTHGGQETTALNAIINFTTFGMIYVGLPTQENPDILKTHHGGGSYYGAGTVAGVDGEKQPSESELYLAERLGDRVTRVAELLRPMHSL